MSWRTSWLESGSGPSRNGVGGAAKRPGAWRRAGTAALIVGAIATACAKPLPPATTPPSPPAAPERSAVTRMRVVATAYNSLRSQTDGDPTMTAHGVELEPGMRVIAVSRDLEAMGLSHGTRVRIEGLSGEWTVVDRMAERWKKRIDVYMGTDVERAKRFGRREVQVQWTPRAATAR